METEIKNKLLRVMTLFKTYGVKSITMNDIAKEMGMSKKTLYKYVSSKEELIAMAIETERVEKKNENMKIKDRMEKDGANVLECFAKIFKLIIQDFQNFSPIYLRDMRIYYSEILHKVNEKSKGHALKNMSYFFEKGIEQGLYDSRINSLIASKLMLNSIASLFNAEVIEAKEFNDPLFYKSYLNFVFKSFLTEKGFNEFEQLMLDL
jgi:AcrR family transcriptional regulator